MRCALVAAVACLAVAALDELLRPHDDPAVVQRNRMLKFALFQDLLVIYNIVKMMVVEGCSVCGVVRRVRWAGPLAHAYLATAAALHAALLLDEPRRAAPLHPPDLNPEQTDLFLL